MPRVAKAKSSKDSTVHLGFEPKLWLSADSMCQIRSWQWSGATWTTDGYPTGERGGVHQYGVPPKGNANFAWMQHFIHHVALTGMAGFVLANGSMSSNQSGEGEIRKAIIEADLVDCMVA